MKRFLFFLLVIITMPLTAQPLSCDTSECGMRINDFEEQQCRAKQVLTCKGYDINALPIIELELQSTPAVVYIRVGNLPRVSLRSRQMGKTLDISHMFANGLEQLRLQAFTGDGQDYNLDFVIRYNGHQLYSVSCNPNNCDPLSEVSRQDQKGGPFYDRIFPIQVNSPVQHEQYSLSFNDLGSALESAVYINDQYTGLTVQEAGNLKLPPSEYRISVGVSDEQEVPYGSYDGDVRYLIQYTGDYYEQRVQGPSDLQDFANLQPLPVQDVVRIGVVPIQTVHDITLNASTTHTLTQYDVDRLSVQMDQTITRYVEPLSYGLQTWNVEFEPMYTQPISGTKGNISASDFVHNHRPDLVNKYDVIIVYYGNDNHWGAAASNGFIHLPKTWVTYNPSVTDDQGNLVEELPLEVFLHETLHVLEQHEHDMLRQWQGFVGLDGSTKHGYYKEDQRPNAERFWEKPDHMDWNRDYMRGKVIALNYMSAASDFPAPADPSIYDPSEYRYVGVFGTLRNGLNNVHDEPEPAIPAADTYRIYNAHFDQYLGATALPSAAAAYWNLQVYNNEYVRLQNALHPEDFLHVDEGGTESILSTDIPVGSWSSHWIPVEIDGRTLLKNRWNGYYLALIDANTLIAVTNTERRTLPVENLAWELNPYGILDSLSSGHAFIRSAWPNATGYGVHVEYGTPETSVAPDGWHSSHWSFKLIDNKYVKITNRWQSTQSLHIENGYLEVSSAPDGWHSAHWELEAVAGLAEVYRLKNRHEPTQYLNMENMVLQSSSIPANYWSGYWMFPKVK